jgi:hypothetical protein
VNVRPQQQTALDVGRVVIARPQPLDRRALDAERFEESKRKLGPVELLTKKVGNGIGDFDRVHKERNTSATLIRLSLRQRL